MNHHWQPTLVALATLSASAYANTPATKTFEPLAREYFVTETNTNATSVATAPEGDPLDFDVYWKDGINFRTMNKEFKAKLGGRIQHDWAWFSEDLEEKSAGAFDFENGTEFRRTRLYLSGTIYEDIEFKTQMDFSSDATGADFKDVYMGVKHSDEVNVRVGQFKEPFSLNELTSSNYIAFMERGLPNGIVPGRNTGAMFHGRCAEDSVTYALGVFKDAQNDIGTSTGSGEYSFTGRVTGVVVDTEDTLVHVGISASMRDLPGKMFDLDLRPSAHLSPRLLNNSAFMADEATLLGAEVAVVSGPFWASGEYIMSDIDAQDGLSDATVSGYYGQAGYFLTGESRPYKRSNGTFGKVKPKNPRGGEDQGCGAWEIALRYGMVEFENLRSGGNVFDDELADITLGVNWYWNTNVRMMFNYVDFNLDSKSFNAGAGIDEGGSAFQTRFQLFL